MKNLFNFSRGEIVAVAVLLAVIVISFLFSYLYHWSNNDDWNAHSFQEEVRLFTERQQAYSDSVEAERQNRKTQGHNRYHYDNFEYSASRTSFDSAFRARAAKQQYAITRLNINLCDTGEITTIPQFGTKRAQKLVE
jgi:hypothetical protein